LPKSLNPFLYELQIQPFIGDANLYGNKSFTFTGQVLIHFTCLESTNKIVLHSKDLTISNYSLNTEDIALTSYDVEKQTDFLTFYANDSLEKDLNYTLKIEFNGIILNKLYGFYRSSYLNRGENKTY